MPTPSNAAQLSRPATWPRTVPRVANVAIYTTQPPSRSIRAFLGRAIAAVGRAPKYIITDKGGQFWCPGLKKSCKRCGIRPLFGAVARYGSIAVVERFIKTLKDEGLRRIRVPLRKQNLRCELDAFLLWYNEARPHH